jgi:hypothetical protein
MGQRTFTWTVPVRDTYDGFVQEVRRRVATRVASRTLGPDGQPVRREIALTQDNQSLRNTYLELISRGMERANIRVVFHTSANDRVERITFSPPPVVSLAPTTITGSPPRPPVTRTPTPTPTPPPTRRRRPLSEEQAGEVAGVAGLGSDESGRYRYFYGVRTTGDNTMCYGRYDNLDEVCLGVETENTMAIRLHYDRGMRDLMYLMQHANTDRVTTEHYQNLLARYERRMSSGRRPKGPVVDRVYREGALEGYRRARRANPGRLPSITEIDQSRLGSGAAAR